MEAEMDAQLKQRIQKLTDEELIAMNDKINDYLPEVIQFTQSEIADRGGISVLKLKTLTPQTGKNFDRKSINPTAASLIQTGSHEKISVKFLASCFFTNTFQGTGFIDFHPDHIELNGRQWFPFAIGLIFLMFLPAGVIPGILPVYYFGRMRATVRIEYDDNLSFTKLKPTRGMLFFHLNQWKAIKAKIQAKEQDLNRITVLLSRKTS